MSSYHGALTVVQKYTVDFSDSLYAVSPARIAAGGDALSGGKAKPRDKDPVMCRQKLQWHIFSGIGSSDDSRMEPGTEMLPQRQVR